MSNRPPASGEPSTPIRAIDFARCPQCLSDSVMRLPDDWQEQVNDGNRKVPIIACGNPWHYATASLAEARATPPALDEAVSSLPDDEWVLMLGHEKYDPIPGSPGEVNHPALVGRMIWWATARRSDPEAGVPLVIVSAERHSSPDAALRDLAGQLRRRYQKEQDR